jgi:hypothetical protein
MTQEQAPGPDAADEAAPEVVEWGDDGATPPGRAARGFARLRADARLPRLVAGVAGLALLLSLFTEWRVSTALIEAPDRQAAGQQQINNGVVSFPAFGAAYLVGLLLLAGCAAVALFGRTAVRANARLVGLAGAGVLGAVLLMGAASLDELGGSLEAQVTTQSEAGGWSMNQTYGGGFYLAFAGVAGMALAFFLTPPVPPRDGAAHSDAAAEPGRYEPDDETTGLALGADGDDWPWRPRVIDRRTAPDDASPLDLTVQAADPFLPPRDDGREPR